MAEPVKKIAKKSKKVSLNPEQLKEHMRKQIEAMEQDIKAYPELISKLKNQLNQIKGYNLTELNAIVEDEVADQEDELAELKEAYSQLDLEIKALP